ncbi:hypothetical protein RB601_009172 [Gaeumannomyces tritici]
MLALQLRRHRDADDKNNDDAQLVPKQCLNDCYIDILNIQMAVLASRCEWRPGLDEAVVTDLLKALESRIQKRPRFFSPRSPFPVPWPFTTGGTKTDDPAEQLPELHELQARIYAIARDVDPEKDKARGMESDDDEDGSAGCATETAEEKKVQRCLAEMAGAIRLFRREKTPKETDKRDKFLRIVRKASRHLLKLYFDEPHAGHAPLDLARHPSNGVKKLADSVHGLLCQHCNCGCRWRRPPNAREARLSLTRHRQFLLKATAAEQLGLVPKDIDAKFEILLPVCGDHCTWKVTDVRAMAYIHGEAAKTPKSPIQNDLCFRIRNSNAVKVNLWAEHEKKRLWAVHPPAPGDVCEHSVMESLHELLGNDPAAPSMARISRYDDRDRLTLAYVLATSVLYLYPGIWLQTEFCWSSNKILFARSAGDESGRLVALTQPYLSANLLRRQEMPKADPAAMSRYHLHPAVLALGIMLLEIATRTKFDVLCPKKPCDRDRLNEACRTTMAPSNEDGALALKALERLEKHGSRDAPPSLCEAIRNCLVLRPPSTLSDQLLFEEGPLRFYVLTCVVAPLATALEKGYGIQLASLMDEEDIHGVKGLASLQLRTESTSIHDRTGRYKGPRRDEAQCQRQTCLFGDKEVPTDQTKINATKEWFDFYDDMIQRVYVDKRSIWRQNQKKVSIAILDSGIELSEMQKDQHLPRRKVVYRSWVGGETLGNKPSQEWKDNVGHGTHLSTLLARVAPMANIHVARVFERSQPDLRMETKNVAQAIWHAVNKWNVDIIVMSFGFDAVQDAADPKDSMLQAIRHAAAQGVGLFAAASNDGKNRPDEVAWPARMPEVICVHSFDGAGNPSDFTPGAGKDQTLAVVGEAVLSAWPEKLGRGQQRYMSGTSCAAPIAAGMAAVILDYARAFLPEDRWLELRRVGGLRRIFDRLTHLRTRDYCYIRPWQTFGERSTDGWIQGEIERALGV